MRRHDSHFIMYLRLADSSRFFCHCFASPLASCCEAFISISTASAASSRSPPSFFSPVGRYRLYSGPWGIPAGETSTSPLTRWGYRTAYAEARYPPSECPTRTILSTPTDSRHDSSEDRKKCSARATRDGTDAEDGELSSAGDGREDRPMPSQSRKNVRRPEVDADCATDSQLRKKKLGSAVVDQPRPATATHPMAAA